MYKEKITYIITNYNKSPYITECIVSLYKQTCDDWLAVIYDDASNDNSVEIIEDIIEDEDRISLFVGDSNLGSTDALKKAIDLSITDIVGLLDSDDALVDRATDVILNEYSKDYKGFIYSNYWHCEDNLVPIRPGYCHTVLKGISNTVSDGISHLKTFRRKEYYKTKGINSEVRYAYDKDLTYVLEEVTEPHFVDDILYYHRKCGGEGGFFDAPKFAELSRKLAKERREDPNYGGRRFD